MENIVLTEFEKQKGILGDELRKKYNLSDEDIENINEKLKSVIGDMFNLVKEGKNAHEKFFSDIILNSIDAIIGYNTQYKIFLWNKGAERIFGYSKAEVMGKDFSIMIPDYLLEKGEREFLINEVNEKGFVENYETERMSINGEIVNVSINRFAIYDLNNEVLGSVGMYRDITKLKTLERELRERENLALIGEVVSSITHSLSNPLNIISGNADYLMLDKKSTDKDYEELKTIVDESARITKSIRHLLNFSRPFKLHKKPNDLNELIKRLILKTNHSLGNKKIVFEQSLQKDLPEFEFDEPAIEELINNLITNAVQAISSEGKIRIKTHTDQNNIKIEITDSGSGIPKENFSKIFLPFFSSKEYGKGTGLGLALTKRIIMEHKGDIKVKSTVGKGTTFTLTIPLDK